MLINFKKYANNTAIIFNNNGVIIKKTYAELEYDVLKTPCGFKEQFIYNMNRYDSLLKHLVCVREGRIFCHLPNNSSDEYIQSIKEKVFKNIIPSSTTHIVASSGTTGTPKLVALDIRNVEAIVKEQAKLCDINESSIVSCFLSYTFDASFSDIYIALLHGATLYITETPLTSIKTLTKEIKEFKLTHLDLPPSLLKFINFEKLIDVKTLIFGGELADENTIKRISNLGIKCFNAYGPTENTICASMRLVTNDWQSNNIGVPFPISYKKSESYKIVKKELHLAIGLFLGYIGDDDLYDRKIVNINGRKYFSTGDLVIKRKSELYYIGRKDRQFKHNGVLICPEEIEYAARNLGCDFALVTCNSPLTLTYTGILEVDDLRIKLHQNLPLTRIPKFFIKKDSNIEENITKNGKTKM